MHIKVSKETEEKIINLVTLLYCYILASGYTNMYKNAYITCDKYIKYTK